MELARDREEFDFAQETYQSSLGPAHFSLFVNFSYCQYSPSERTLQVERRTGPGVGGGAGQADGLAKGYSKHYV